MQRQLILIVLFSLTMTIALQATAKTFTYVSLDGEKRIAVYQVDPSAGTLTKQTDVEVESPAGALCVSPDHKYLFASLRQAGKLASFGIDGPSGSLTHINTVTAGADPAFVTTDATGTFLLTAYYVAAKVTVHKIESGRISPEPIQTVPTADKAHAILTDRENRFVFVPHTGPNAIHQFHFNPKTGRLTPNDEPLVRTGDNTGPRQLAFHPRLDIVFFDYEQGSAIAAFELDRSTGRLSFRERFSSLPDGYDQSNSNARIEITPNGRYVYVANRGHDSLAGYAVNSRTGRLSPLGQTPTEPTPRGFGIDPTGRLLIAAGQSSDKLAVFRIDANSGQLTRTATYDVGSRPWWVLVADTGHTQRR